eukprot:TRINITY_DN49199_c0_g1_i1.p1 TRINITY_DN49199_c0_g1~~TRINITY_DN49199_c0_g1_i1.p1  ORF type:complete len:901 (+),score=230.23 TRINITY_DN49199_c0_g1_i1:45-2705(+)
MASALGANALPRRQAFSAQLPFAAASPQATASRLRVTTSPVRTATVGIGPVHAVSYSPPPAQRVASASSRQSSPTPGPPTAARVITTARPRSPAGTISHQPPMSVGHSTIAPQRQSSIPAVTRESHVVGERALTREQMIQMGRLMPASVNSSGCLQSPLQPGSPGSSERAKLQVAEVEQASRAQVHRLEKMVQGLASDSSARQTSSAGPAPYEPPQRVVTLLHPEGPEILPPGAVVRLSRENSHATTFDDAHVSLRPASTQEAEAQLNKELSTDVTAAADCEGLKQGERLGPDESHRIRLGEYERELEARLAKAEGARLFLQAELESRDSEMTALRRQAEDGGNLHRQNAELRVELAASKQMQESLKTDASKEARLAEELKEQLLQAQASLKEATLAQNMQDKAQNRTREVSLEAELARAHKVADQIQQDLASEAATAAQLRSQLSMAAALSQDLVAAAAISAALAQPQSSPDSEELQRRLDEESRLAADLQQQLAQALQRAAAAEAKPCGPEDDGELEHVRLQAAQAIATAEELHTRLRHVEEAQESAAASVSPAADLDPGLLASLCTARRLSAEAVQSLLEAVRTDNVEALKAILNAEGASEEALLCKDQDGCSLLQLAIRSGSFDVASALLEESQQMNERHEFQLKLQEELLEKRRKQLVNGFGPGGCGALAMLCRREDASREVLASLMAAQADPYQPDSAGVTPFMECARTGNVSFMKLLLNGTRGLVLLDTDRQSRTALHHAAQAGQREAAELLLKAGEDASLADAMDLDGCMAASLARDAGHTDLSAMLAEALSDDALEQFLAQGSQSIPPESASPEVPVDQDWAACSDEEIDESFHMDIPEEEHLQERINRKDGGQPGGLHRQTEATRGHGPGHRLQSL